LKLGHRVAPPSHHSYGHWNWRHGWFELGRSRSRRASPAQPTRPNGDQGDRGCDHQSARRAPAALEPPAKCYAFWSSPRLLEHGRTEAAGGAAARHRTTSDDGWDDRRVIARRTWGRHPPSSRKLSGRRCEKRWGLRSMGKKIFLIFNNFRISVRRLWLEVSERDSTGEDHHDVTGLQHHVGAGAPARLPRPGARRQRAYCRAVRERPRGTRRAYPPTELSTVSTVEPLDRPRSTPARGGAALAPAALPPTTGRFAADQRTPRRFFISDQ